MKFIPDVRRVLKRAWSLRMLELAALVDIILNVVPSSPTISRGGSR